MRLLFFAFCFHFTFTLFFFVFFFFEVCFSRCCWLSLLQLVGFFLPAHPVVLLSAKDENKHGNDIYTMLAELWLPQLGIWWVFLCVCWCIGVCVRYVTALCHFVFVYVQRQLRTMLPGSSCHEESERLKLTAYVCVCVIYAA